MSTEALEAQIEETRACWVEKGISPEIFGQKLDHLQALTENLKAMENRDLPFPTTTLN